MRGRPNVYPTAILSIQHFPRGTKRLPQDGHHAGIYTAVSRRIIGDVSRLLPVRLATRLLLRRLRLFPLLHLPIIASLHRLLPASPYLSPHKSSLSTFSFSIHLPFSALPSLLSASPRTYLPQSIFLCLLLILSHSPSISPFQTFLVVSPCVFLYVFFLLLFLIHSFDYFTSFHYFFSISSSSYFPTLSLISLSAFPLSTPFFHLSFHPLFHFNFPPPLRHLSFISIPSTSYDVPIFLSTFSFHSPFLIHSFLHLSTSSSCSHRLSFIYLVTPYTTFPSLYPLLPYIHPFLSTRSA